MGGGAAAALRQQNEGQAAEEGAHYASVYVPRVWGYKRLWIWLMP